jgi:hypothetical protein
MGFLLNYTTALPFILKTKEHYEFPWSSQVDKWVNSKCHGMGLLLVLRMVMLFIYGLFNHGASSSDYIVLSDSMTMNKEFERLWKDVVIA